MAKKKNKEFEGLVSTIGSVFNSLKPMADTALNDCIPKVNRIIKNKIKDENTIEHLLDDMMNLCFAGASNKYFFKLLDYYGTFNKASADFHRKFYKDLTD